MTGFAVIRHSGTGGIGTAPADAMEYYLANGWVRVSEYCPDPSDLHLPDFADAPALEPAFVEGGPVAGAADQDTDHDPAPEQEPVKTTKESKR